MVRKATTAGPAETNGAVDVDEFAITAAWSKAKDYKKPFKFKCPSGQMTLIHRLDMADLLKLGVAEDMDFMAKALMATEATAKEADAKPDDAAAAATAAITKADNFNKLEGTINLVVQAGLLKPKTYLVPRDENARQAGLFYIDSIPFEDRMVLFTKIFETEGLTTFRKEQSESLGDVVDVPSVSLPAE
jgi:hypothetical protein